MHLRCPCTAAMATADPPAPTEHIGSERAHARGLPAMLQLCSPSISRPAQIKEQLELDVEEHRRIAERHYTRTASGRATTLAVWSDQHSRGLQLSLRVGGSNHPHPVMYKPLTGNGVQASVCHDTCNMAAASAAVP